AHEQARADAGRRPVDRARVLDRTHRVLDRRKVAVNLIRGRDGQLPRSSAALLGPLVRLLLSLAGLVHLTASLAGGRVIAHMLLLCTRPLWRPEIRQPTRPGPRLTAPRGFVVVSPCKHGS